MSVRNSLLSILAQGKTHGYGLKAAFEEVTMGCWPLNIGQVYTTLNRLERDGLVRSAGKAPDDQGRQPWQITSGGRQAVDEWMAKTVDSTAQRDELLIKVLMAAKRGKRDEFLGLIQAQRHQTMATLQGLTRRKFQAKDDLARKMFLEALILRSQAEIAWLDHCEKTLESHYGTEGS